MVLKSIRRAEAWRCGVQENRDTGLNGRDVRCEGHVGNGNVLCLRNDYRAIRKYCTKKTLGGKIYHFLKWKNKFEKKPPKVYLLVEVLCEVTENGDLSPRFLIYDLQQIRISLKRCHRLDIVSF